VFPGINTTNINCKLNYVPSIDIELAQRVDQPLDVTCVTWLLGMPETRLYNELNGMETLRSS
jgi:hypothetical protein